MKKISLIGLVLGAILGIVAALLVGVWIIWLGAGLAIGLIIGSIRVRRGRFPGRHHADRAIEFVNRPGKASEK